MVVSGIAASDGIAIGKVFKFEKKALRITNKKNEFYEEEIKKLNKAIDLSKNELTDISENITKSIDKEHGEIFLAHREILVDPEIYKKTVEKIEKDKVNAAFAYHQITEYFAKQFENMKDEYFSERAVDVRDVSRRVISHLLGVENISLNEITNEVILIARDLTPSDTAQLNQKFVRGFITNIGGKTSHSAIMARSIEIPAVVGTRDIMSRVKNNDLIILDGISGKVIINPSNKEIEEYKNKKTNYVNDRNKLKVLRNKETITACGKKIELAANIGSPKDIETVIGNGAEGIGLYRTEFLYMESDDFPTEEEQFIAYKKVCESLNPKPVVIRTLDIGGDKELKYLKTPDELNPFLGHRAIRLCFEEEKMFETQIRALLRASAFGNIKIMFPMIATIGDFRRAKGFVEKIKKEFDNKSIEYNKNIEIGIMVEIPATAILADCFAKEVDFFSIGTNDLIQYTFAADRMNQKVSYLYQPYNPSLLRLIKMVIDSAHAEGKWVGMCGEMAGDPIAIPLLVGLGLDEFSMSATSILKARHLISNIKLEDAKSLVESAIYKDTSSEVKKLVNEKLLNRRKL